MSLLKNYSKVKIPHIILFGAPGVGKGTYGSMLEKDLKYKRISTGDQIRAFLKRPDLTPEMEEIKKICQTGGLVNDKMVLEIIVDSLKNFDSHEGVIFDGFPRNLTQLDLFADKFDLAYSYVINCLLNEEILIEKLAGRRVCDGCGTNFNICSINRDGYDMKPLMPKHGRHEDCDCCTGKLVQREDDHEHTVRNRLVVYKNETEPLLQRFSHLGLKMMHFEPKRGVDDYPNLFGSLKGGYLSDVTLLAPHKMSSLL